ncbi:MAG: DUF3667 domain-containing protein, partial [Chitinophagaceae bacterium]
MKEIPVSPTCQSCGALFQGKYCSICGEKKLEKSDFSMEKFLSQTVDVFTHFDGKFFRTIKLLLFFPGKLTTEALAGRRVKYMKPVQLFFVICVASFFTFGGWDLLHSKLENQLLVRDQSGNLTPKDSYSLEMTGRI